MILSYFYLFFGSLFAGVISLFIFRLISLKNNIFKSPRGVPYIGGIAFSFSFLIFYLFFVFYHGYLLSFQLGWIIFFSFLFLIIEFIDDLKDFPFLLRVIIQIVFIGLFLVYGKGIQIHFLPAWLNYLLSFLWLMGISNAFNLFDISDGLCAGVSLIAAACFFVVFIILSKMLLAALFLSLAAVLLAFFFFNFPPAKVFMGNSGSHFLGFLFAALSMYGDYAFLDNWITVILPVLILAFPIIDTFLLIFIRVKKHILPFRKSDDHLFLQLVFSGYKIKVSLLIIYFITFFWGMSGIFICFGYNLFFILAILTAGLSTFWLVRKILLCV